GAAVHATVYKELQVGVASGVPQAVPARQGFPAVAGAAVGLVQQVLVMPVGACEFTVRWHDLQGRPGLCQDHTRQEGRKQNEMREAPEDGLQVVFPSATPRLVPGLQFVPFGIVFSRRVNSSWGPVQSRAQARGYQR